MMSGGHESKESARLIRNVGIVAHIDAGKTTLTERILFICHAIRRMGEVHEGTTVTDWLPQERERGISINAAAVNCKYKDWRINVVDTPGHVDFTAEVERSLSVLDGIVTVVCGVKGVQAQTETVWRTARRHGLPALVFVNKMDREGANAERALKQIAERLQVMALPVQYPVGAGTGFCGVYDLLTGEFLPAKEGAEPSEDDKAGAELAREYLVECLAETDERVQRDYLNNREPSLESLRHAIRRGVIRSRVVPVLFGSALCNQGVEEVLDAVGMYLPSPEDRKTSGNGNCTSLQVFRVSDFGFGPVAFARIYSGKLHPGQELVDRRNSLRKRIDGVFRMLATEPSEIGEASAGDIVALGGDWSRVRTGDILSDGESDLGVRMRFPVPVVSESIRAFETVQDKLLEHALKFMQREDPCLRVKPLEGMQAWIISGMGELHLEIVRDRLRTEFGILTEAGEPHVEYRETVSGSGESDFAFEKHLPGGACLRAQVAVEVVPLERGKGLRLEFSQPCAALEGNLKRALELGVTSVVNADAGGYPMTDMKVTVLKAESPSGVNGEPAVLTAARSATGEAIARAGRVVLEPVMQLEVNTPADTVGSVIADLNARRGQVAQVDIGAPGLARIVAMVPLADLFGYASSLRSLSAGRGEVVAEPAYYAARAGHE